MMNDINSNNDASNFVDIRYIDPGKTRFEITPGGFLSMFIEPDEVYPIVHLYRMLPFSMEDEYISVTDKNGKEIGFIKSLKDFPPDVVSILSVELNRRYFIPIIRKINSIKDEFGFTYWEVETDAGERRFTTRSGHNQVIQLNENRVLIIDLDGNRFEIEDYKSLGSKYSRIIETLL